MPKKESRSGFLQQALVQVYEGSSRFLAICSEEQGRQERRNYQELGNEPQEPGIVYMAQEVSSMGAETPQEDSPLVFWDSCSKVREMQPLPSGGWPWMGACGTFRHTQRRVPVDRWDNVLRCPAPHRAHKSSGTLQTEGYVDRWDFAG